MKPVLVHMHYKWSFLTRMTSTFLVTSCFNWLYIDGLYIARWGKPDKLGAI